MVEPAFASMSLKAQAFSVSMHPTRPLVACGTISGQVKLFEYDEPSAAAGEAGDDAIRQQWSARPHREGACRCVAFAADGQTLFSTGVDGTLQQRDVATNKPTWRIRKASPTSINTLALLGEVGVATGDDDGAVRCWDLRQRSAALSFHEHSDYVADMLYTDQRKGNTLAVAGGDGHLAVFDLRAGRLWARSDPQEDELLCCALLKRGRKLLCGTQTGTVGIFSWGDFGDVSDRLLGHPASVDCMTAFDEDNVITASSDGLIRLVSVHPNKVLGVLGDHSDAGIESLALNAQRNVLASCAQDQTVRLWNIAYLNEEDGDGDGDGDGDEDDSGDGSDGGDDAKDGESGSGSDDDESEDEDDGPASKRRKQHPTPIAKKNAAIKLGAGFFEGLGDDD